MKVIIASSREFNDYKHLCEKCDYYLKNTPKDDIEIVCGMTKGADLLGYRYAIERGYKVAEFPAEWNVYGKAAGYYRNEDMGDYANFLILFWDGESSGSEHMLNIAEKKGLNIRISYYKKSNV